jgi:hypothetical protein
MQLAQRPGIRQFGNADGCCPSTSPGCGFRDDGQSDAVADHPAGGVKASKTNAQFERLPGLNCALSKVLLKGVGGRKADEFVIKQGSKRQAALIY